MDNREIISKFIDDVLDGSASAAKQSFQDVISIKVSDALENKKQEVANSIYSGNEKQEEDSEE